MELRQGLMHVYTGDGKGKTSAALGLALRASGRGLRVLFQQFFKLEKEPSGEQFPVSGIVFRRGDYRHPFFDRDAKPGVIRDKVTAALQQVSQECSEGRWDVVVLDEVNNALRDGFLPWAEMEVFLAHRPAASEVVCTGRGAPAALLEKADYVTEFRKVRHPVDRGIAARQGIEF